MSIASMEEEEKRFHH